MRIFKKFFFNLTKSRNPKKRLFWLFFSGARPNNTHNIVLVYFSTWHVSPFLVEESNIYVVTAKLSNGNNVFNATSSVQNIL